MLKDILDAITVREEVVIFAGRPLLVREMNAGADLEAEKDTPASDLFFFLMIACVFEATEVSPAEGDKPAVYEAGARALTVEDIPKLKAGSVNKLAPLTLAVKRVNGLDIEDEAGKPAAAQA